MRERLMAREWVEMEIEVDKLRGADGEVDAAELGRICALAERIADGEELAPVVARPLADCWEVVGADSERRWRAAVFACRDRVRCRVMELTDAEVFAMRCKGRMRMVQEDLFGVDEAGEAEAREALENGQDGPAFAKRYGAAGEQDMGACLREEGPARPADGLDFYGDCVHEARGDGLKKPTGAGLREDATARLASMGEEEALGGGKDTKDPPSPVGYGAAGPPAQGAMCYGAGDPPSPDGYGAAGDGVRVMRFGDGAWAESWVVEGIGGDWRYGFKCGLEGVFAVHRGAGEVRVPCATREDAEAAVRRAMAGEFLRWADCDAAAKAREVLLGEEE